MNAESVKARLKNIAVKDGGTMQDKLITYALERSIYRLSVSKYVDRFTLKGGIFYTHCLINSLLGQREILIYKRNCESWKDDSWGRCHCWWRTIYSYR